MAVAYWNLVLTGRFKFLDLWNRFLMVREQICNTPVFPLLLFCVCQQNITKKTYKGLKCSHTAYEEVELLETLRSNTTTPQTPSK